MTWKCKVCGDPHCDLWGHVGGVQNTPDTAMDLACKVESLKSAIKFFINKATPEEDQKWGIDIIISEELYSKLKEWTA